MSAFVASTRSFLTLALMTAACGHGQPAVVTPVTTEEAPATEVEPSPSDERAESGEAPIESIDGPFTPVGGTRIHFGRETIEATLPARTRLGTEDAYARLGVYGIDDDSDATFERMHYEYENCVLTVRIFETLFRSPPELLDDATQAAALAQIGATASRTEDPSLWVVRRADDDLGPVLLERGSFAMRVALSAIPIRAEDFDDDETNDYVGEEAMQAATNACEVRGDVWLSALVSTLRNLRSERASEPQVETVRVPGPDGRDYEVRVPEGHDVAVRDWYHGVEVELQPRTFYGEDACSSVLVATANSPTGYEPAPANAPTRMLLGRRIGLVDEGTEGPGDCPRRVGVVPAGRNGVEWVVSLLGGDAALAPILDALGRARRVRRAR